MSGPEQLPAPLSVREALRGRRLLVTGASGFLGKVWLGQLLEAAPEVGPVRLLLRGRGGPRARLEELLGGSPAFGPWQARWGERMGAALGRRLVPVEGDLTRPLLGLSEAELAQPLDLVVHLGALTDLEPDLEQALRVNVDGALAALEVARRTGAAFLHVSTAYVAGAREGLFPGAPLPEAPPRPASCMGSVTFEAERELQDLRRLVLAVDEEARDQRREAELREQARAALRRQGLAEDPAALAAALERTRAAWARGRRAALGGERARAWGWANAYALSKALAEMLIERRGGEVRRATVRPSIVESAQAWPFAGWKEGHQTSAPLLWALTEGPLRALPGRGRLRLDVLPVDLAARGLTLAAAALLRGECPAVIQLGTSQENPLTLARAVELTNLARRAGEEETWLRLLLPDARPVSGAGWRLEGPPLLKRLAAGAGAALGWAGELLPGEAGQRAQALGRQAELAARKLERLEEVVETFRPFLLEHDLELDTSGARALSARLPEAERAACAWEPGAIDWREYWTAVHLPGLRRWVFPALTGRRGERWPRLRVELQPERLEQPSARLEASP